MTNMTTYRKEFDAKYPSGDAYTGAIRWALVAERAVIAQLQNLEDTSFHSVEIFRTWAARIIEFYRYIGEKYPSGCSYYEAICRTLIVTRGRSAPQFEEAIANLSTSPLYKEVFGHFGDYVVPRSFYITKKGYIGLAPDNVRVGDTLAIFWGGNTPYIIRQRDDGSSYEFVGETYTYGLMNGEALEIGDAEEYDFLLL